MSSISIWWFCLGRAPRIAPCDANGTSDRTAEAHVKGSGHSVVTGTDPDALQRMVEKFRAEVVA